MQIEVFEIIVTLLLRMSVLIFVNPILNSSKLILWLTHYDHRRTLNGLDTSDLMLISPDLSSVVQFYYGFFLGEMIDVLPCAHKIIIPGRDASFFSVQNE